MTAKRQNHLARIDPWWPFMLLLSFPDNVAASLLGTHRLTGRSKISKKKSGNESREQAFGIGKTACSMSLGFHEKPLVRAPMASEEEPQHDQPGQEVGEDQGPPREDLEEPLSEDRDQPQREHLEAAKQHEDEEEQAWVSIGGGQQAGGYQPEGHKGHPVEQGVLENHPGR